MQNPLPLPQLTALLTLLNQALDIIDISRWTGDPHNGAFISGQLRLLADTIEEAQQTLRGGEDVVGGKWWEVDMAEDVRHPAFLKSPLLHQDQVHCPILEYHCLPSATYMPFNQCSVLLTLSLFQDIFTSPSPKPISPSLNRRRRPCPARPHSCSSVYTRVLSYRSLPSYSARPEPSTAYS